jgi:hypothetical protein
MPIQRLFLYDEGEPTIEDLLKLSVDQVLTIAAYVDARGFEGSPDDLLSLANRLGLSYEKTADLIQYGGYLQSERTRLGLDVSELLQEFDIFLERHNLESEVKPKLKALYEPLRKLFADRPEVALREKVASVTAGVVPEGVDFRSICDLRPIFNEERDGILDYTTIALVRVLLRSETHHDSTVFFQIDSQGLDKLEKFLIRLRTKMRVLDGVRKNLVGAKK